ncbi:PREDICTED: WD repeat-containing protein WRAP73-like isoform X2 [Priapulus caudatus]|uniref:WD repeat-containing protein WRAP73-like isoform X2 n=1 Tax=Priapulus caudatus TaxID=37621 RepID=A0ABM1E6P7_PRICU|nr:PREDICTED: WD repeat-containing protein WRAP73-like isoform X2 [Priapulus caudatus]
MNFSELFKQSNHLCGFSPNGKYLASAVQFRLVVRDVKSLQILQLFTCADTIQYIGWAPDSCFLVAGMFKRGIVQVWSIDNPEWTCKIDEGSAGLTEVQWSPDSRHLLTTADFHLRITVWSLVNKSVSYMKYPKKSKPGLCFTHDGKYMALAERRDCKDVISIFVCSSWELVKNKVLMYSVDGRCLSEYSPYRDALGIKTLSWSPSSQFLAIGSYDEKLRILNHITWKPVAEHCHPGGIESLNVVVYKEVEKKPQLKRHQLTLRDVSLRAQSKYEVIEERPVNVKTVKPVPDSVNPRLGVGLLSWSADNKYLVTRNDNMPCTLWIWDLMKLKLMVALIHAHPVRGAEWEPTQSRLAVCTGTNKLYLWQPAGCVSVEVPSDAAFQVTSLSWSPTGGAITLIGKDQFCVAYLTDEDEEEDT